MPPEGPLPDDLRTRDIKLVNQHHGRIPFVFTGSSAMLCKVSLWRSSTMFSATVKEQRQTMAEGIVATAWSMTVLGWCLESLSPLAVLVPDSGLTSASWHRLSSFWPLPSMPTRPTISAFPNIQEIKAVYLLNAIVLDVEGRNRTLTSPGLQASFYG